MTTYNRILTFVNSDLPIYTLRFPGIRLYIVQSTTLISAVQKQARTISFAPVMVRMAAAIMGSSKSDLEIIGRDPVDDDGHIPGMQRVMHGTLRPGVKLDALNRRTAKFVTASIDALASSIEAKGSATINMYQWITHQVMMAVTEGIYGPQNPFRDDSAVPAFR